MKTPAFNARSLRTFAHEHDDLPAFHAAYLVLTFLAAAMLNLGFFALIILVHMALDIFKYREVHNLKWSRTIEGVLRESLIDLSLFFMGLVVAVYLHPDITGVLGIKGMMLAEITVLRGIGIITPKLKIMYDMLKILSHIDHYLQRMHPRFGGKMQLIEYVSGFSICIAIGMLLLAPIILMLDGPAYLMMLAGELVPWRL